MSSIYKIIFINDDKMYEIYAKDIMQSEIYAFIEVENILFGEQSSVVVDPSEEKLKSEFANVTRTFIPMHNIIRIDMVPKQGTAKIKSAKSDSNIKTFPSNMPT